MAGPQPPRRRLRDVRTHRDDASRERTARSVRRKVETNPLTYRLSASGFLAEIDRMQLEVREYLALHPSESAASA